MKYLFIKLIRLYQIAISPNLTYLFGHGCRFQPTCSEYMKDAVEKYGVIKGFIMGMKRYAKCHPGTPVTYDPVH